MNSHLHLASATTRGLQSGLELTPARESTSDDAAIDLIVAACGRTPRVEKVSIPEALARMAETLVGCLESALWLAASGFPEERAHEGPLNEWDHLGTVIISLGAAALDLARATSLTATPLTDDELLRSAVSAHRSVIDDGHWPTEPTRSLALARWSGLVRNLLSAAVRLLSRDQLTWASDVFAEIATACVEMVAWLAPRVAQEPRQ
jgi:hypothetical protein